MKLAATLKKGAGGWNRKNWRKTNSSRHPVVSTETMPAQRQA
jgi:hypothetical protein